MFRFGKRLSGITRNQRSRILFSRVAAMAISTWAEITSVPKMGRLTVPSKAWMAPFWMVITTGSVSEIPVLVLLASPVMTFTYTLEDGMDAVLMVTLPVPLEDITPSDPGILL